MNAQWWLLALPSALALAALLWHRQRLQGGRLLLAFCVATAVYAVLRAGGIERIMQSLGGERPYRLQQTVVQLGSSSPQEVIGWGVALLLAWGLAERALAVAGWRATPARVALLAMVAMGSVCAAVEGAAIASGWWTWTLPTGGAVAGWNVPSVALLDWSFVALDLLLPFLVWCAGGRGWTLGLACLAFPLHFAAHLALTPLSPSVPLDGFGLVHLLLPLLVAAVALAPGRSPATRIVRRRENAWWLPSALALALALWTFAIAPHHDGALSLTSLPLAALALTLLVLEARSRPAFSADVPAPVVGAPRWPLRVAVVLLGIALGAGLLWPSAQREQALESEIRLALSAVGAKRWGEAEAALTRAEAIDAGHGAVAVLRGLVALSTGRDADAVRELDRALDLNPHSRPALRLAAAAALRQGRAPDALTLARRGRGLYPDDLVLRYLESAGARRRDTAALIELALASPQGPGELIVFARLADDRAMQVAASEALGAWRPSVDANAR